LNTTLRVIVLTKLKLHAIHFLYRFLWSSSYLFMIKTHSFAQTSIKLVPLTEKPLIKLTQECHSTQSPTQTRAQLISLLRILGVKCLSLGIPANTAAEQSSLTIFMVASKLSIRGFLAPGFWSKTEHR